MCHFKLAPTEVPLLTCRDRKRGEPPLTGGGMISRPPPDQREVRRGSEPRPKPKSIALATNPGH